MTKFDNSRIRSGGENYMLSYAFQVLNEQGYKNIATEQFNNTAELMAAILAKGIAVQTWFGKRVYSSD